MSPAELIDAIEHASAAYKKKFGTKPQIFDLKFEEAVGDGRAEFEVREIRTDDSLVVEACANNDIKGKIHRRQVTHRLIPRRKAETVSVTREQLAKAWDEAVVVNHQETSYFPKLCKALGFKEPK